MVSALVFESDGTIKINKDGSKVNGAKAVVCKVVKQASAGELGN